MSREVRRVPMDWQHPMHWHDKWDPGEQRTTVQATPRPLFDRSILKYHKPGEDLPDEDDLMPEFPKGTATGWCMYETTSEGTPISPVLGSPEELARWLADNRASSFGSQTATYDQWLRAIQAGWAPSAVVTSSGVHSGVEAIGSSS